MNEGELREHSYYGYGIVSFRFDDAKIGDRENHGEDDDEDVGKIKNIFGVKVDGKLKGVNTINWIADNPVYDTPTMPVSGKVLKIKNSAGMPFATVTDKKNKTYPAVVYNTYGRGKTLYYASIPNTPELCGILKSSIPYVTAPDQPLPAGTLGVDIDINANLVELKNITLEMLPANFEVVAINHNGETKAFGIEWDIDQLNVNDTQTLTYLLRLPDEAGIQTVTTEARYLVRGTYYTHSPFESLALDISIARETVDIVPDLIDELNALSGLSGEENSARGNIIDILNKINTYERKKAIKEIQKAIKKLEKITSVDTMDIHRRLDEILFIKEK